MQRQMDSLFNSFSGPGVSVFGGSNLGLGSPRFSFDETETEYQVHIEFPPDQEVEISTNLEANLLTVNGTITQNISKGNNGFASNFTSRSQFSRSFDLSKPVDELALYTQTEEGGLLIGIPKK